MKTPAEKLDWDLKVTAGSRFAASRRLRKSYRRKQWFSILFSILIVFISALTLVFEFPLFYTKLLGFIALASSIFIVVFSAAQIENSDAINAHRLYQSAVGLAALRREFAAVSAEKKDAELLKYSRLYNEAIVAHGVNHENEDYYRYKLDHWWEFEDLKDSTKPGIWSAKIFDRIEEIGPQSAVWAAISAGAAGLAASLLSLIG